MLYNEEFTISRKIWMVANHPLDKCVLNWCGILREEEETSSWPGWLTWLIVFSLYKSIYIYILMYRAYLPPPLPRVTKKIIFYFREIFFENLFVFFYIMWCKHKILLFRKNCFCNFVTFSRNCFCRSSTPPPPRPTLLLARFRIDLVSRTVEHIKLKQAEKPAGVYAGFKE